MHTKLVTMTAGGSTQKANLAAVLRRSTQVRMTRKKTAEAMAAHAHRWVGQR